MYADSRGHDEICTHTRERVPVHASIHARAGSRLNMRTHMGLVAIMYVRQRVGVGMIIRASACGHDHAYIYTDTCAQ